ncbi:MAG: Dabb family protein [Phycisphaerales bacterium]|nr:Dabb family protein [Phycisphaerales bacterium]
MLIHAVFFWFKPQTPPEVRQRMIDDAHADLSRIPSVRHLWSGRPAMTPRDVVDNTYDVGLCVILDDQAGLDAYQPHELHQQYLAKYKSHWQRILVYDFK